MSGLMQLIQIILKLDLFDHLETYIAKNSANALSHPVGRDTNDLDISSRVRKIGHLPSHHSNFILDHRLSTFRLLTVSYPSFKTWRNAPVRARAAQSHWCFSNPPHAHSRSSRDSKEPCTILRTKLESYVRLKLKLNRGQAFLMTPIAPNFWRVLRTLTCPIRLSDLYLRYDPRRSSQSDSGAE